METRLAVLAVVAATTAVAVASAAVVVVVQATTMLLGILTNQHKLAYVPVTERSSSNTSKRRYTCRRNKTGAIASVFFL